MSGNQRAGFAALFASIAALALSACNGGPASAPPRDQASGDSRGASSSYAGGSGGGYSGQSHATYGEAQNDPRRLPVPMVHGKPMWAANRLHTAQENAQYQFERDGADFDAHSVDEFVSKVHAFVDKPPQDVLTLTRANGDRLLYDAHGNVFAVVTKDGAPRTMFKPRDGAAYWDVQKQRVAAEADGSNNSGYGDGGGGRYYGRKSAAGRSSDDQG